MDFDSQPESIPKPQPPSPATARQSNVAADAPPNPAEPRPRLTIQRLQLRNFKSYGGTVNVGPFHKNFSSIVGPNGSGKSNVIDAMLFVFGRRAKQLRHSKLSELLHNSATYPNVQSATVTVFFQEIIDTGDGEDDFQVVPGSEFSVSRTAYRNNTSKYHLNGAEVKMKSVVDLLKAKGVDLDNNRFLILQGEVEQIALMKPKATTAHEDGLLEYLEDIIGSNRHIEKIDEAAAAVETLNEERGHKLNRVKAAERERDALESAKVEAEDHLDKEREMLTKKIKLWRSMQFDVDVSLKENSEKFAHAKEKLDNFKGEVQSKEESVENHKKTFENTQKRETEAVRELNEAKDAFTAFERKDIKLREDMKALKTKKKKLETQIVKDNKRIEENTAKVEEFQQEKEDAKTNIAQFEDKLKRSQEKFDRVRDKVRESTAPIREKLEKKQAELLPFSEAVNEARKQLQVNQSTLNLLAEKLAAPQKNLEQAESSEKEMAAQLQAAQQKLLTLQTDVEDSKTRTIEAIREGNDRASTIENISNAYSQMRRRVQEARSAREFSSTRSRLHNAILSAARDGHLQGVVGRLGDLASVDREFEVAVSAAAGSNLDCIVVRTAENAQACIQFLRRENLGRATFIILEKVEYLRNPIESWGRSDQGQDGRRLFDFLNIPNPQNRTALYYSLRDTLVANSLEEARRIAFKPTRQNRVVTTSGELIESSGAMTGGGRGPTRYKLGSGRGGEGEMDSDSFRKLCDDMERAKSDLDRERGLADETELRRVEAASRAEDVGLQVTRSNVEVSSLQERLMYMRNTTLPALHKAMSEMETAQRRGRCEDSRRRDEAQQAVKQGEKQLEEARAACEGIESDIGQLQEEIIASGGGELERVKKDVETCRAKISEVQSEVSTASSRAKAASTALKKAEAAVKKAEAEIEEIAKQHVDAKEESEQMLNDAEVVSNKRSEAEEVHQEWVQKLKETQINFNEAKEELKKLRRTEVSLVETADGLKRRVNEENSRLRGLKKEEQKMKKKIEKLSLMGMPSMGDNNEENGENEAEDAKEHAMEIDEVEPNEGDQEESHSKPDEKLEEEARLSADEKKRLETEVAVLQTELSKSNPNVSAIAEYARKDSEYRSQVGELDGITSRRDEMRKECDRLRKMRLEEFMSGFSTITLKLKELYQMITLGGDAELELVDSLDPFSEGIVFSVRPPKKSWKNICNLSGGEKTLSSLALVFALHHFKPTPLYFLDEIDAALDYKNVSIVGNYVQERTKDAQFIIISLRNNMFELADRLVGIYKTRHATKSATINPRDFVLPNADTTTQATSTQAYGTQATMSSLG